MLLYLIFFFFVRTQWSPIRPLIIRMIKQIATPTETQQIRRRSPDLFNREWKYRPDWTTDEVMLPINHNYNKIFDKAVLKLTWYAIYSQIFCLQWKRKPHTHTHTYTHIHLCARDGAYLGMTPTRHVLLHWPIMLALKSGQLIANQNWELRDGYD